MSEPFITCPRCGRKSYNLSDILQGYCGFCHDWHVSMQTPGFWMHETSGVLKPVVEAYLNSRPLNPEQVATMRAYLRQWINAPGWRGPTIESLREKIDGIRTSEDIHAWLDQAAEVSIDPL